MAWVVLLVSGVMEAVWATALGKSDGFSRFAPSVVFAVGLFASMAGLAYALRTLPIAEWGSSATNSNNVGHLNRAR